MQQYQKTDDNWTCDYQELPKSEFLCVCMPCPTNKIYSKPDMYIFEILLDRILSHLQCQNVSCTCYLPQPILKVGMWLGRWVGGQLCEALPIQNNMQPELLLIQFFPPQ